MTKETIEQVLKFRDDRDWKQFHNPKDLAISISLEAAELLEIFQWSAEDVWCKEKKEKIREELADVLNYCILMADTCGLDMDEIVQEKVRKNAVKYPVKKYPVVTLCGSTRFKDAFLQAQKELTLKGNIVLSVGSFGHSGDSEVWEGMNEGTLTKTKEMLDDMHKRKIDMADRIFVINVGGYIGSSTRSEIAYAKAQGIPVDYLEP